MFPRCEWFQATAKIPAYPNSCVVLFGIARRFSEKNGELEQHITLRESLHPDFCARVVTILHLLILLLVAVSVIRFGSVITRTDTPVDVSLLTI